jgi:hypothetical protein
MVVKVVYKGSFGRKFEIKTRGSAFSVNLIDEITILCTRASGSFNTVTPTTIIFMQRTTLTG